ncbi:MAG: LPS assembly protein LptD, partial [Candidatus Didemnitutus sp.]|nr:LPS assembly protein LptD [Candidatus Didemnitutus sp.]
MSRLVPRFLVALLLAALLPAALLRAQTKAPVTALSGATGRETVYDDATKQLVLRGDARIVYGDIILTADEIRYSRDTNSVDARGHFVLTNASRRLVADAGTYNLTTGILKVQNLRVGDFPIYVRGESVEGTFDEMVFTNATIFFREEAAYAPSLKAKQITYRRGRIVSGEGLQLGLLGGHIFNLPHFEHDLTTELISLFSGKLGYRRSLGAFVEASLRLPVAQGVRLGGELGLYSSRGVMIGPAATYQRSAGDNQMNGGLSSGYINDYGNRLNDIFGRPVPKDRSFVDWTHHHQVGSRINLDGQFNYWSDSEVLRDFRSKRFFPVQQPDSFFESAYAGDNFLTSAFLRVHPNRFHRVQERLPELRFDLLPSEAPLGFYERLSASFAVLEEDSYLGSVRQRSTRFDAYYGIERPFPLTPWFTFTPVAGARVTHYTQAVGGRSDYTRTLTEVGFDARLRAGGTFDYRNEIWEIDGLRHLIEPRLSYRYAPRADAGTAYIPAIDRRVFSTYLQPLSIGDRRNLDELERLDTLRLALHNTLLTRDTTLGSRELASLNLAADHRFSRQPGDRPLSDLHTEFSLTPASWVRFEVFQRFTPKNRSQQELNYALTLEDQEWWSLRLSSYFLKQDYEEYTVDYRHRLNE